MAIEFDQDQVLALAPDTVSAKAGVGLASASKWQETGKAESAVWGLCQGSGASPYRTQVDLSGPAFKCSCPSHKFPCKHGLALLLLYSRTPALIPNAEPPQWVATWLAARGQRKTPLQADVVDVPLPEKPAPAKSAQAREERILRGMDELQLWLSDLVADGLIAACAKPRRYWDSMAARMIDSQAPGLARMVKECGALAASGAPPERLLAELGMTALAISAYKNDANLPPALRGDVRTVIGWPQSKEDALAQPRVTDQWHVLGEAVEIDDRLTVQRLWLHSTRSARFALLISYVAPGMSIDRSWHVGKTYKADLCYYPAAFPLRAVVTRRAESKTLDCPPVCAASADLTEALAGCTQMMAANPFLRTLPIWVDQARLARDGDRLFLSDRTGAALEVSSRFGGQWQALAQTGGWPATWFCEWDGERLNPMSLRVDGADMQFASRDVQ